VIFIVEEDDFVWRVVVKELNYREVLSPLIRTQQTIDNNPGQLGRMPYLYLLIPMPEI